MGAQGMLVWLCHRRYDLTLITVLGHIWPYRRI